MGKLTFSKQLHQRILFDKLVSAVERGENNLHGFHDFVFEHGSRQHHNLVLTVLFVPKSLDSERSTVRVGHLLRDKWTATSGPHSESGPLRTVHWSRQKWPVSGPLRVVHLSRHPWPTHRKANVVNALWKRPPGCQVPNFKPRTLIPKSRGYRSTSLIRNHPP